MKYGKSVMTSLLASVAFVGLLTGCSTTAKTKTNPDSFTMAIIDDGTGFDPRLASWGLVQDSLGIFEGLVHAGPDGKPAPGMAASWESSSDGKVWTFHLRSNIKYSNGDPVTAQDFVYSIKRAVNPVVKNGTQGSPVTTKDIPLVNITDCQAGTKPIDDLGVKALDDKTLQFTLSISDHTLPQDLTLWTNAWVVPLDQKVVQNMSEADWTNPSKIVSNGPYMVQSYQTKTSATLVPNPHYYQKVNLKKVSFVYSNTNQLLAYKSGSLDMALLQPTDIAAVNANASLKQDLHMWTTSAQYSFFPAPSQNTTLQNPDVRKALEMAIDKNAISNSVLKGTGVPAYQYNSPTWLDPWIKDKATPYDPTEAKALLAKAGFPDGKGFPTVQLLVGTTTDNVAEEIQQMWETNLGIKVKFLGEEWGQYTTDRLKVLPKNMIGFVQSGENAGYPQFELPTNMNNALNNQLYLGYLPADEAEKWVDLANNKSMNPTSQMQQQVAIMKKYLPSSLQSNIQLGYQAYTTGDTNTMQQYFWNLEQGEISFSVYTPVNPVLLRSDVKGYYPNKFLLTDPPVWLNYITR